MISTFYKIQKVKKQGPFLMYSAAESGWWAQVLFANISTDNDVLMTFNIV